MIGFAMQRLCAAVVVVQGVQMDDSALYNSMHMDGLPSHQGSEDSMVLLQVRVEKSTRKNAPASASSADVQDKLKETAHDVKELAEASMVVSAHIDELGDELSDLLDVSGGEEQQQQHAAHGERGIFQSVSSFASHVRSAVGSAIGGIASELRGGKSDMRSEENAGKLHSVHDLAKSNERRGRKSGSNRHAGNREDVKLGTDTKGGDDSASKMKSELNATPTQPAIANISGHEYKEATHSHSKGHTEAKLTSVPSVADHVKSHSHDNDASHFISHEKQQDLHRVAHMKMTNAAPQIAEEPPVKKSDDARVARVREQTFVQPDEIPTSKSKSDSAVLAASGKLAIEEQREAMEGNDERHKKVDVATEVSANTLSSAAASPVASKRATKDEQGEAAGGVDKRHKNADAISKPRKAEPTAPHLDEFETALAASAPTKFHERRHKKAHSRKDEQSELFSKELRSDVKDIEEQLGPKPVDLPDVEDVPDEVLNIIRGKRDDEQAETTPEPKVFDMDSADDFASSIERELAEPPAKPAKRKHAEHHREVDDHFDSYEDAVRAHSAAKLDPLEVEHSEDEPRQLFRKVSTDLFADELDLFKPDWRKMDDEHQLFSKERSRTVLSGKAAVSSLKSTFGSGTADLSWMTSGNEEDLFKRESHHDAHVAHAARSAHKNADQAESHTKGADGTSSHSSKTHAAHHQHHAEVARRSARGSKLDALAARDVVDLDAAVLCEDARSIDFAAATVTRNNLGSQGPDVGVPEGIVFEEIAEKSGRAIDLVVTATSDYAPNDASKNGIHGVFGVINLQANSGVDVTFRFVDHLTGGPVVMDPFYFTFYDLDQGMAHGSREQLTVRGFSAYALGSDTQLETDDLSESAATFTSSKRGGKLDNPTAPSMLTRLQRERSVTATFAQVSDFSASFSEDGYADLAQGRNFFFTGPSALVCGQDGRCATYGCPRGFQRRADVEFLACDESPCTREDRDTCCYEEEPDDAN